MPVSFVRRVHGWRDEVARLFQCNAFQEVENRLPRTPIRPGSSVEGESRKVAVSSPVGLMTSRSSAMIVVLKAAE